MDFGSAKGVHKVLDSDAGIVGNQAKLSGSPLNFKKLFSSIESSDQSLQFFKPKTSDGKKIALPPAEVYAEGKQMWSHAVLAQFVGRAPNFSLFQKMANML
ncbi:hypothetical protein PTKIN_Ptkin15bG0141100 [Pterospermum kingtungense]